MARVAKSPVIEPTTIEREIVARLRAAKLRPRFDKEPRTVAATIIPRQPPVFTHFFEGNDHQRRCAPSS